MKIITLKGETDVGKTSTIRMVYQALWQDEKNTERISFETDGGDKCDFIAILRWEEKIIVIKSLGDKNDESENEFAWIENGIEIAKSINADVLLNTLNTRTLNELKYKELVKSYAVNLISIEKHMTVEEMARQEVNLCKRIINELRK